MPWKTVPLKNGCCLKSSIPFWPSRCSRLQISRRIRSFASSDTSDICCGNWNLSYVNKIRTGLIFFFFFSCPFHLQTPPLLEHSPCGSWFSHRFRPGTLHRREFHRTAFHTCRLPGTTSRTQAHTFLSHPPWPGGFQERCSLGCPPPRRTGPEGSTEKVRNRCRMSAGGKKKKKKTHTTI